MEIDKRSNLEHHVTEAATLAMTTVWFTINRFLIRIISGASVLEQVCLSDCKNFWNNEIKMETDFNEFNEWTIEQ